MLKVNRIREIEADYLNLAHLNLDIDEKSYQQVKECADNCKELAQKLHGIPSGMISEGDAMDTRPDESTFLDILESLDNFVWDFLSHVAPIPKFFFVQKTKAVVRLTVDPPQKALTVDPWKQFVITLKGSLELAQGFKRRIPFVCFMVYHDVFL